MKKIILQRARMNPFELMDAAIPGPIQPAQPEEEHEQEIPVPAPGSPVIVRVPEAYPSDISIEMNEIPYLDNDGWMTLNGSAAAFPIYPTNQRPLKQEFEALEMAESRVPSRRQRKRFGDWISSRGRGLGNQSLKNNEANFTYQPQPPSYDHFDPDLSMRNQRTLEDVGITRMRIRNELKKFDEAGQEIKLSRKEILRMEQGIKDEKIEVFYGPDYHAFRGSQNVPPQSQNSGESTVYNPIAEGLKRERQMMMMP